jgi:hypothetical protein
METFKKILILIIALVVGYFVYVNFFADSTEDVDDEDSQTYESGEAIPSGELPPIPDSCKRQETNLENAIYGAGTHQSSIAQRNNAARAFEKCLKDAGFSQAEIDGTIAQVQQKVARLLKQDGY